MHDRAVALSRARQHRDARLLAVDERYARRMILERRVPIIKVGRLVCFDLADIREWVEQRRRPCGS